MILWNLFESLLFQGSYSNLKAIHKSQSLQLDKQLITDTITYFRNRYIANNATTPYYANLRLRLTTSSVSISRDLHCWQMSFSWIPFGYHRSWSFNIGVKAASLSDLKYDKSQSMYDNMY